MTKATRKRLFNVLRIALCVGALWIVAQGVTLRDHVHLASGEPDVVGAVQPIDVDAGFVQVVTASGDTVPISVDEIQTDEDGELTITYGLLSAWRMSSGALLLLALVIHFPVILPQALRFRWLLHAQGIHVGYMECIKLSFAGNFLNFATPLGSNAGDVFKAYFVSLHTDRKTEAATTVLLDRIIGLVSLLIIAGAITTFCAGSGRLAQLRPYVLGFIGAGVVAVLVYLSPLTRRYLVPTTWLQGLPMYAQLQRIDRTARVLVSNKKTLIGSILLTMVLQGSAIGAYFTVAVALRLDAHLGNMLEYYAYFFAGVLVQTLPGPPQGLGTVELAYRYFFAPFGGASQIVCMAFFIRLLALTCALPGLLVTVTGSYKPRVATESSEQMSEAASKPDTAEPIKAQRDSVAT